MAPSILCFTLITLGHFPTFRVDGPCHWFKPRDGFMQILQDLLISSLHCSVSLTRWVSLLTFVNSVNQFFPFCLSLLWMHAYEYMYACLLLASG